MVLPLIVGDIAIGTSRTLRVWLNLTGVSRYSLTETGTFTDFGGVLPPKRAKLIGKSDEHIVPKWLIEHLGMRDMPFTSERVDVPSRQVFGRRQHSVTNFVAGSVCAYCNNGWMSSLEDQAKPILIRLIGDPHELSKLSGNERHIVAQWTFKTAAVLNRASSYGNPGGALTHPVPDEHLRIVKSGAVPDNVVVVGSGCVSTRISAFVQNATWASPENSVLLRTEDRDRSYKIGMSFRSLLLAVAYYPSTEYFYGLSADRFIVLAAGPRSIVRTQDGVGEVPIVASLPVLEGFVGNLFVVSKTWWELRDNVMRTRLIGFPNASWRRLPPSR